MKSEDPFHPKGNGGYRPRGSSQTYGGYNPRPLLVVDPSKKKAQESGEKVRVPRIKKPESFKERIESYFNSIQLIRNVYRDDQVIGPNIFEPGLTDFLKRAVLQSSAVKKAMKEYKIANPLGKKPEDVARGMIDRLAANFHERKLRGLAYTVHNVLFQLYTGIHISEKDIKRISEIARKAHEEKVPMILLPPHKSHVDYLVVSYTFLMLGISLPFIAAGDNLMIPIVGSLLRSSGAFFIKRRFDDDKLYRAIFTEYVETILRHGFNLEFFIEGGRSRTGKLLRPKMGLLSIVINAVLTGRIKDAYLVPLSIGYDKVIETPSYVQELLGAAKEKESLGLLLQSTSVLKLNFGRIDIRLSRPFSLREYLTEEIAKRNLQPLSRAEDVRMINQILSYSILYRINKAAVIMPTSIVVTVLLTSRGRGMSRKELIRKFEWLREEIVKRGGKVATPKMKVNNAGQLVDGAIKVLGNLVTRQKNVLEPVFSPQKRFVSEKKMSYWQELAYYRNQLLHNFINEGIISCSLYKRFNLSVNLRGSVARADLLKDVSFLSQLLKIELIFLPSPNIEIPFQQTLLDMQSRGTIDLHSENDTVSVCEKGLFQFNFLCALFWPFIDCYWLLCSALYSIWPTKMTSEKAFLHQVQSLGFTLYYRVRMSFLNDLQGELNYYESVAKDTLTNALHLFTELGVVERQPVDQGMVILKLTPKYQEEKELVSLIETISSFRRMSKYATNPSNQSDFSNIKDIVKLASPVAKL